MTLPQEITDLFDDWYKQYGDVPCNARNGKGELKTQLLKHASFQGLTKKKVDQTIDNQIRKRRKVIQPQKTNKDLKKRKIGEPGRFSAQMKQKSNKKNNAKWSPINNAKYNAKNNAKYSLQRKKARLNEAVRWLEANLSAKDKPMLTDDQVEQVAEQICKETRIVIGENGQSMTLAEMAKPSAQVSFYVGLTMQQNIAFESLRWLTVRGKTPPKTSSSDEDCSDSDSDWDSDSDGDFYPCSDDGYDDDAEYDIAVGLAKKKCQVNRPVLKLKTKAGGARHIKMKEARENFGFRAQVVFESPYKIDASRVEDCIQTKYQHLRLGKRLWRYVAKGPKSDKADVHGEQIYKVFITSSTAPFTNENITVVP